MFATNGDIYEATIPGQPRGTIVQFKVIAIDGIGNVAVTPVHTYKVTGFPMIYTLAIIAGVAVSVTAIILIVIKKRR